MGSLRGTDQADAYAAREALARGLALEFSPVRVNAASPGLIATPIRSKMDAHARESLEKPGKCLVKEER